jgi:bifunctional enzyme CysN/CysC
LRKERESVRASCHNAGLNFSEIYISASIADCEKRDPRGLYQKARKGEIQGFTGIDSPYEAPEKPDLISITTSIVIIGSKRGILFEEPVVSWWAWGGIL